MGGGDFLGLGGGGGFLWDLSFVKCSFNYPECIEKCIRGEYIVKYTRDRKILLTFQDEWIQRD